MAIVVRVKAAVMVEGALDLPDPSQGHVRGIVRLWREKDGQPGVPDTPTDKYLVVGDDIGPTTGSPAQRYGEAIQTGHLQRLGGYETFLTARGLSLDDFLENRNFRFDMAVPASLIDAYTG